MEIKKCLERKDGIKMVIVPKTMDVKKGEYIGLVKIIEKEVIDNGRKRKS